MFDTKQPSQSRHRLLSKLLSFALCLFVAALLLLNRQYIVDQISVWQYAPSSEISSLAKRSAMSDTGTFYFYASQPRLQDATSFNEQCGRREQHTAILGCYNGQFIYIYNVADEKLDGIREVTAAHEMLHAAYTRLNGSEKKKINELLEAEYEKLKNDKKFVERMAFYERTEPGERSNELHSLIGTEVMGVSAELTAHYKRYFTDRGEVVALYERYASVFADLQNRSEALSAQVTQLRDTIEAETNTYNNDVSQFNRDVEKFEDDARNDRFATQAAIDATREALLVRASALDGRRNSIAADLARFETLRSELTQIASQSEALNRSIDSNLAPAPSSL